MDLKKKIASYVVKAQVASDSGKGMYSYLKSDTFVFLNEEQVRHRTCYRRNSDRRELSIEDDTTIYLNDRSERGLLFNDPIFAAKADDFGYDAKAQYILKAILLINSNRRCGWNYWVKRTPDQHGYSSIITYFEYKNDGIKLQISFHTPIGRAPDSLIDLCGKGRRCHWDYGSSRNNCQILIDIFNF